MFNECCIFSNKNDRIPYKSISIMIDEFDKLNN